MKASNDGTEAQPVDGKPRKGTAKGRSLKRLLDILDCIEQSEHGRWQVALDNLKAAHATPEFMPWAARQNWAIERELVRAEAAIDTIKLIRHVRKMSNIKIRRSECAAPQKTKGTNNEK